jgi:hypothetical protein
MRTTLILVLAGCSTSPDPGQTGTPSIQSGALCVAENSPMPACVPGLCDDCLGMMALSHSEYVHDQGSLADTRGEVMLQPNDGYHLWHVTGPGMVTMRSSCFAPFLEAQIEGYPSGPLPSVDSHWDGAASQYVAAFALDARAYIIAASARDNVAACPKSVVTGAYSISVTN